MQQLSVLIEQIINEHNLTKNEFADSIGIDCEEVDRWENGFGYPNKETLYKISELYDVSIYDLTGKKARTNAPYMSSQSVGYVETVSDNQHSCEDKTVLGRRSLTEVVIGFIFIAVTLLVAVVLLSKGVGAMSFIIPGSMVLIFVPIIIYRLSAPRDPIKVDRKGLYVTKKTGESIFISYNDIYNVNAERNRARGFYYSCGTIIITTKDNSKYALYNIADVQYVKEKIIELRSKYSNFVTSEKNEVDKGLAKLDKMWSVWENGKLGKPMKLLLDYYSQINNGGHLHYFENMKNDDLLDITYELKHILPSSLYENLSDAFQIYRELNLNIQSEEQYTEVESNYYFEKQDNTFFASVGQVDKIIQDYANENL